MVRVYTRVSNYQAWKELDMKLAIVEVKSGNMGLLKASKLFSVPRTTLQRRLQSNSIKKKMGCFATVFNKEQEDELVAHIFDLEKRFFGITAKDLRGLAFQLAEKNGIQHRFNKSSGLAGKDWLSGFRARDKELSLRTPEATSKARAQSFNKPVVSSFFALLKSVLEEGKFSASRIYNVDETGVTTVG